MSPRRGRPFGLHTPLGIVGPGSTPDSTGRPGVPHGAETAAGLEPRRFVVPGVESLRPGDALPELRRIVREGGLLLGVDQTALFIFGEEEEEPVQRLVRFRLSDRRFDPPASYPAALARDVRALLASVSRAEVSDLGEHAAPPGAMRDYLVEAGVRGLLSLPLRAKGRTVGFVTFEATAGPRRWTEQDRARAQGVASRLETRVARMVGGSDPAVERPDALAVERQDDPAVERPDALPPEEAPPTASLSPAASAQTSASPSGREFRSRLPRLRALEGAALIGADLGGELLDLIDVQDGILLLFDELLTRQGDDRNVVEDLRELSARLRTGLDAMVGVTGAGVAGDEVVDLNRMMASLIHRLAEVAGEGARFLVAPSPDHLPVRADPFLLSRALEHLVGNARNAIGPSGRIRLSWGRAPGNDVRERCGTEGGRSGDGLEVARIQIEDDGRGIRPEHLPWVFEPFFSGDAGSEASRGLGLSTVQAVIEGHGGWVDLESRPGEGTLVSLYLPLAAPVDRTRGGPAPGEAPAAHHERVRSILVVEHDPILARLLERILVLAGFRVRVAATPSEAERVWEGGAAEVDAVVVNRHLEGGRDGPSLVRGWKRDRSDLPAVFVDRRSRGPVEGWTEFEGGLLLRPPFEPGRLLDLVREVLGPDPAPPTPEASRSEASPAEASPHSGSAGDAPPPERDPGDSSPPPLAH